MERKKVVKVCIRNSRVDRLPEPLTEDVLELRELINVAASLSM